MELCIRVSWICSHRLKARLPLLAIFPTTFLRKFFLKPLDWKNAGANIVGMFQKEVAERIAAPPGSKVYGVISVLLQAFYKVEYLFDVPPGSFNPPPKVMSGVIRLMPVEKQSGN